MLFDDMTPAQSTLWVQLQAKATPADLPSAMLWVGGEQLQLYRVAQAVMATVYCEQDPKPCGGCQSCRWVNTESHPDVERVQPKPSSQISVEAIRELSASCYLRPQQGKARFIVIEQADSMTIAAANALLKILEEPPEALHFILITKQSQTMLPTILSRCHQYHVATKLGDSYTSLGEDCPEEGPQRDLLSQSEALIGAIEQASLGKISPCQFAEQWSEYALGDLAWALYVVTAERIRHHVLGKTQLSSVGQLFSFLDRIKSLQGYLSQGITLNKQLALEGLVIS